MENDELTPEELAQKALDQSVKDIQSRLRPVDQGHWTVKRDRDNGIRDLGRAWKKLARRQGELLTEYQEFTEKLLRDLESKV